MGVFMFFVLYKLYNSKYIQNQNQKSKTELRDPTSSQSSQWPFTQKPRQLKDNLVTVAVLSQEAHIWYYWGSQMTDRKKEDFTRAKGVVLVSLLLALIRFSSRGIFEDLRWKFLQK